MTIMNQLIRILTVVFFVTVFSGCDSQGDKDPSVTGRWSGTMSPFGLSVMVAMDLLEADQEISGTGTVDIIPFTLFGTHRFPNISFTAFSAGFLDSNYSGTVSSDGRTMTGTWTEASIGSVPLTLRK